MNGGWESACITILHLEYVTLAGFACPRRPGRRHFGGFFFFFGLVYFFLHSYVDDAHWYTNRSCKMCLQTSARLIRTSPFHQIGVFVLFFFLTVANPGLNLRTRWSWTLALRYFTLHTHTLTNAKPLQVWLFGRHSSVRVTCFFLLVKIDKPVPAGLPSLDKMPVDMWRLMIREEVDRLNTRKSCWFQAFIWLWGHFMICFNS